MRLLIGLFELGEALVEKLDLDGAAELVSDRKGAVRDRVDVYAAELDVGWRCEDFLEGVAVQFELD